MIQTEHTTVLLLYRVIQCDTMYSVPCHFAPIEGAPRGHTPCQVWQLVHGVPWVPMSSRGNYLFNRGLLCITVGSCMNHCRHPCNAVSDRRNVRGFPWFPVASHTDARGVPWKTVSAGRFRFGKAHSILDAAGDRGCRGRQ